MLSRGPARSKHKMASQTHISPLLFLAAIATAAAKLTPEWRVVSAAKGVTTRARIDATSQLCAVHGEAVVEASVAELMSVFGDLDQHGHWDATLVDAREWTGADGGTYVYQRFKQPWPVRDRELVLRRREWRRNQTVSVHFESVDEGTPVAPGAVRTLAHGVWWNFTAVSETETLISHYSCVDPGGPFPPLRVGARRAPSNSCVRTPRHNPASPRPARRSNLNLGNSFASSLSHPIIAGWFGTYPGSRAA